MRSIQKSVIRGVKEEYSGFLLDFTVAVESEYSDLQFTYDKVSFSLSKIDDTLLWYMSKEPDKSDSVLYTHLLSVIKNIATNESLHLAYLGSVTCSYGTYLQESGFVKDDTFGWLLTLSE